MNGSNLSYFEVTSNNIINFYKYFLKWVLYWAKQMLCQDIMYVWHLKWFREFFFLLGPNLPHCSQTTVTPESKQIDSADHQKSAEVMKLYEVLENEFHCLVSRDEINRYQAFRVPSVRPGRKTPALSMIVIVLYWLSVIKCTKRPRRIYFITENVWHGNTRRAYALYLTCPL